MLNNPLLIMLSGIRILKKLIVKEELSSEDLLLNNFKIIAVMKRLSAEITLSNKLHEKELPNFYLFNSLIKFLNLLSLDSSDLSLTDSLFSSESDLILSGCIRSYPCFFVVHTSVHILHTFCTVQNQSSYILICAFTWNLHTIFQHFSLCPKRTYWPTNVCSQPTLKSV